MQREEHGELRAGRITSTSAKMLRSGTKTAWERLAQILDDPPPFYESTSIKSMAAGISNEPIIARRWMNRHPEIAALENPGFVRHHDASHKYYDLLGSSPDRVADGIPVEIKFCTTKARYDAMIRPMANGFVKGEHLDQVEWHAWNHGTNACWFVVATENRMTDLLYKRKDLSHFDKLLELFMEQYITRKITGLK